MEPLGPITVSFEPRTKLGPKKGNPWMWSQCVWLIRR